LPKKLNDHLILFSIWLFLWNISLLSSQVNDSTMSSFDDAPSTLVSTKLQGVALRTPPPSDTYVIECIVHPSDEEYDNAAKHATPLFSQVNAPTRRILRLANHATAMDVLHQLNLITAALLPTNSRSRGDDDDDDRNEVSVVDAGIRTQLFAVHPASGDGSPFTSTSEANLLSRTPIRELLGLRFPFTIAITPSLSPARTAAWTPEQWRAALMAHHNTRLNVVNSEHAEREASMRKPLTGADVIKPSAVMEASLVKSFSSRHQNASQYSFMHAMSGGAQDDETNIIVTPAANNLSMHTSPESPSGFAGGVPTLLVSDARAKRSSLSLSTGNTPRTPLGATGRRTSSPGVASPTPSNLSNIAQSRQEKRNAAQVERQRLQDLQRLREQNIAALEQRAQQKSQSTSHHVVIREEERAALAEQERKVVAERQARLDSRTQRSLESKRSLQEQHAARLLEKKMEYQRLMEAALLSSSAANNGQSMENEDQPFKDFGSTSVAAFSGTASGSAMNHSRASRARSIVELPDAAETELSKLELEQAKTNFVNRVAASRKATERRMSRFSTVKYHPFAVHAELQSLLGELDATAHHNAVQTEQQQRSEREREHEHATAEYHRLVMDDSIKKRVAIKMERKVNSIEHHAQLIAFEKVKKQSEEEAKKQSDAEARARIAQFYEKKKLQEAAAIDLARRQKEMAEYVERQRMALQSLVPSGN
jgi:hypothetical protein